MNTGLFMVGCEVGMAYLTGTGKTLPTAKKKLQAKIAGMTGMEYGIDYTFKDKMV